MFKIGTQYIINFKGKEEKNEGKAKKTKQNKNKGRKREEKESWYLKDESVDYNNRA